MKKTVLSIISMAVAMAFIAGCFTKATAYTERTNKDGTITVSHVSIIGTGDKVSQVAAEGLFADGTDEDLGAGVKKASASQQSTGIGETLTGMGSLMAGMAKFMAASQGIPAVGGGTVTAPAVVNTPAYQSEAMDALESAATVPAKKVMASSESVIAAASVLASKMAEAKASGKPLVVIAGNKGCSYCAKLDSLIEADPAFLARTDFVLYRETSPWETNQAGKWTGGGLFPVLRITQWSADGATIECDKIINRPRSVGEITAALSACSAPK